MPIGVLLWVLSSYDSLGCLRYLRIRTIFKMANIVTWQERGINLLATKYASKDILITSSHSDMSETSPYGYIVHVNSAVRKELLS